MFGGIVGSVHTLSPSYALVLASQPLALPCAPQGMPQGKNNKKNLFSPYVLCLTPYALTLV
jgi:hypothetical protein